MPADLTTIRDHPAVLLTKHAERDLSGLGQTDDALAPMRTALNYAADFLREYEGDHGVTFVALSKDALGRVQDAYEALVEADVHGTEYDALASTFSSAVADLLGLD